MAVVDYIALRHVMQRFELRGVMLSVYIVLVDELDATDWRPIKHLQLARLLHVDRATVTRAIGGLLARQMLERRPTPDDSRYQLYRLLVHPDT